MIKFCNTLLTRVTHRRATVLKLGMLALGAIALSHANADTNINTYNNVTNNNVTNNTAPTKTSAPAPITLGSANTPEGFATICAYNQTCALTKPNLVAFGHQGQYVYKIIRGGFVCNERAFNRTMNNPSLASCSVSAPKAASKTATLEATATSANNLTGGIFAIVSRSSGEALALAANGQLQQAPYTGDASQQFTLQKREDGYFTITSHQTTALEIKDWQLDDGAQVALGQSANSWNQHWLITETDPNFIAITSRFNEKSLDIMRLNTHNKAKIRLWTYWGGDNQQWQLIPVNPQGQ